jgi:hypothetical protein
LFGLLRGEPSPGLQRYLQLHHNSNYRETQHCKGCKCAQAVSQWLQGRVYSIASGIGTCAEHRKDNRDRCPSTLSNIDVCLVAVASVRNTLGNLQARMRLSHITGSIARNTPIYDVIRNERVMV